MFGEYLKNYNLRIVLNLSYAKKRKKYIVLILQNIIQSMRKQIITLIIPHREGWHYLAIKKLSTILRGIT